MSASEMSRIKRKALEPCRMEYALQALRDGGITDTRTDGNRITFMFNGHKVTLYPFTGWFTSKAFADGRGIKQLIQRIKTGGVQ